jgi:hypothetical protein
LVEKGGNVKRLASVLGFLSLLAACATSSPTPKKITVAHADDIADNPTATLDPDTVVCETVQVVGSHIPQRVCITHRDREEMRQQTQTRLGKTPNLQVAQ